MGVSTLTKVLDFGSASAFSSLNKEAANLSMTFTLFKFQRHFPHYRCLLKNGISHRLS